MYRQRQGYWLSAANGDIDGNMLDIDFEELDLGSRRKPTEWVAVAPPVVVRKKQVARYETQSIHVTDGSIQHTRKLSRSTHLQ